MEVGLTVGRGFRGRMRGMMGEDARRVSMVVAGVAV